MSYLKNKKGQIAIWIILALVIVVAIALFFTVSRSPSTTDTREVTFQSGIEDCTKKAVEEAVDRMLPQGGFISPGNYKLFNDIKVAYLCESRTFYKTCVNQHPMLINEMKEQILNYSKPKIEKCFENLKAKAEAEKSNIEMGGLNLDLNFAPRRIYIVMNRKITITKNEQINKFEKFNIELLNPFYELVNTAIVITNEEAKRCYFEYVGYMLLNPDLLIKKFAMSDSTKVYTIQDKQSKKEMNIAIKSCALRAGL